MLKSLLQLLLETFHKSHRSVPSLTGVQSSTAIVPKVSSTNSITVTTGVAPCDGLVRVQLEDNQARDITLFLQYTSRDDSIVCYTKDWGWPSCYMPIAKGDSYIVHVRYGTPPTVVSILHIDFYPNFGAS